MIEGGECFYWYPTLQMPRCAQTHHPTASVGTDGSRGPLGPELGREHHRRPEAARFGARRAASRSVPTGVDLAASAMGLLRLPPSETEAACVRLDCRCRQNSYAELLPSLAKQIVT